VRPKIDYATLDEATFKARVKLLTEEKAIALVMAQDVDNITGSARNTAHQRYLDIDSEIINAKQARRAIGTNKTKELDRENQKLQREVDRLRAKIDELEAALQSQ
jgi:hypothetical protein